jgi:hypothetical protein
VKIAPCLFALLVLTSCSTPSKHPESSPETVLVTYHVKAGKEAELQAVLSHAWEIYQKEHLVFAQPHVIVREEEQDDKTRLVEIFTWVSHEAPEHAPDAVKKIWDAMQALCEARNGHGGLEGGEVGLVAPK